MGIESICLLKVWGLFERLMSKQRSLNWLCSPKLEITEVLESLVISSRNRDLAPLISAVTLFGGELMEGGSSCCSLINYWDRGTRAYVQEGSALLVKLVGWVFPWPVPWGCPFVSWVLMETWSHALGTRWMVLNNLWPGRQKAAYPGHLWVVWGNWE